MKKYEAIFFDLFDTLILFDYSKLPTVNVNGKLFHSTASDVYDTFKSFEKDITFEDFHKPFVYSYQQFQELKKKELREYHNKHRFKIFLENIKSEKNTRNNKLLDELVKSHMDSLTKAMYFPTEHKVVLEYLKIKNYKMFIISNFDHSPTAISALEKFKIKDYFVDIFISDEIGWRKPHRKIFEFALNKTELDPFNVILIGDNYEADIIGSANKGIDSIWINTKNQIIEDKTIKPKYEISELVQLTEIL